MSLEEFALSDVKTDRIFTGQLGRNQIMWDLGLDPNDFENRSAIWSKIKQIDKTFDLVLLTEK